MTLKNEMFKKSLIATALVISTLGAFAQAPATPATTTKPVATATTAARIKSAEVTKLTGEETRKAKHHAKKVKRAEAKAAQAKDAKLVKPEVAAKQ
jgi:hypothetical protein